ncbi:MAG: endopeptidase La [Candidatus Sumerlaeota bacterium]|nr:endopeptidase La [Candidatus Sumerlaeota bacterium]
MSDDKQAPESSEPTARADSERLPEVLPVLPVQSIVVFPFMIAPVMVNEKASITLVEESLVASKILGMFTTPPGKDETDPKTMLPTPRTSLIADAKTNLSAEIYSVGTAARILKMLKIPDGSIRLLIHGLQRIQFGHIIQTEPYLKSRIEICAETGSDDKETQALIKNAHSILEKMVQMSALPEDVLVAAVNLSDPGKIADMIASNMSLKLQERQRVLEILTVKERLRYVLELLEREFEVLQLGSKIQSQVQTSIDKTQRDYYLREQMKAIKRELGETEETPVELQELRQKIEKSDLPEKAREVALRELGRLEKMHPSSAEYTVSSTYLDWILALPWSKLTKDNYDLKKAQHILDEDHYGLEKIKERILEHLAVIKLKKKIRGPILCFVGPPGVGKTSLGKSIARALGRKFYRFSVGGMHDEAEIRGHRRTYIGSLPGRILKGLRDCDANNPVMMLDEIDKIGADYRGDPSSALLETLDPEQNFSFNDNYLDMPFDLSSVMFITTANILDTIPAPLLDRMEVLHLSGYTAKEKLQIARQYLVPRQTEASGLTKRTIAFSDEALTTLIEQYTREAGVRNLEREIGTICHKIARRIAEGDKRKVKVEGETVKELLGPEKIILEQAVRAGVPGVATGLAWTPAGGELLFIETTMTDAKNGAARLTLTGHLGDVMKESVQASLSFLNANCKSLKIPATAFSKHSFHVHVPAGAIPKDGPSAGLAICSALYSLLKGLPFPEDVALTGEISLTGKALPIGGLKEKVLAAHRAGIKRLIAPIHNKKDLSEIPQEARDAIRFIWVEKISDVLSELFDKKPSRPRARRSKH